MAKTAYPTQGEIEAVITSTGLTVGSLNSADARLAALDSFERQVGRKMLAPSGAIIRYYDPPTGAAGLLNLGLDLATLTSVKYQPRGASAETLTENTDYWLRGYAAPSDEEPTNEPWTHVEFTPERRIWTEPLASELHRAILVEGRWGYSTTIPDDAWWAMLTKAVSLLVPAALLKLTAGIVRTESAGASTLYGDGSASHWAYARREWEREYAAVVARYRKVRI